MLVAKNTRTAAGGQDYQDSFLWTRLIGLLLVKKRVLGEMLMNKSTRTYAGEQE
jgi:hypothetical protein